MIALCGRSHSWRNCIFIRESEPAEWSDQAQQEISYRAFRFPVIKVEEINAVSGIDRIIPMLAEIPLIVSRAIKALENR